MIVAGCQQKNPAQIPQGFFVPEISEADSVHAVGRGRMINA